MLLTRWPWQGEPGERIERTRALAKAGNDPRKRRRVQTRKPADGVVSWTEETFERLKAAVPEPLVSRMRVDHAMIGNVVNQPADPVETDAGADGTNATTATPKMPSRTAATPRSSSGAGRGCRDHSVVPSANRAEATAEATAEAYPRTRSPPRRRRARDGLDPPPDAPTLPCSPFRHRAVDGSKGDCLDNAVAESFFATLKKELIHRQAWPAKAGPPAVPAAVRLWNAAGDAWPALLEANPVRLRGSA